MSTGAAWGVFKAASIFAFIDIIAVFFNKANIFFLQKFTGVDGVAVYGATYIFIDSVSVLGSEQLLGWVIFPLLAGIWITKRERARALVRTNALWLMVIAFPLMFFFHVGSPLIIGLVYSDEYLDSIWMQQYLVWTILLSFEVNLFRYVMMVAGAIRILLGFTIAAAIVNLALNFFLVPAYGLAGGCLVIILTKLFMTVATFLYCQIRFNIFRTADFLFPAIMAGGGTALYFILRPWLTDYPAGVITLIVYILTLWRTGPRGIGRIKANNNGPGSQGAI
jgi:O-antigen/teichoic acid export membrane protein